MYDAHIQQCTVRVPIYLQKATKGLSEYPQWHASDGGALDLPRGICLSESVTWLPDF